MAHKYAINQYYSIQTDNLLIFSSQVNIKKTISNDTLENGENL